MASNNVNPRIQYLTDDMINVYSGANVLTTWQDLYLKSTNSVVAYQGGPLDPSIFGSIFSNQCNCGAVRRVGKYCPECKSRILDETTAWTRYARIDLPVYYVNKLRFKNFVKFMNRNFKFDFSELTDSFKSMNEQSGNRLIWDYCQFEYDKDRDVIVIKDLIDDYTACSYDSLLAIITEYYPQHLSVFRSFVNTSILVVPMIMRAPKYSVVNGVKELVNHELTTMYKMILYVTTDYYPKTISKFEKDIDKAMFNAQVRLYVTKLIDNISRLLKTSKMNLARTMNSHRVSNSGRCTIIPSPQLKVDEVEIPRHLMYECCREEFIKYLRDTFDWSKEKANLMYTQQCNSEEIQQAFEDYIDHGNGGLGKYVIINRNPSLYELSMQACKVKLTNNYTMGIPLLLCVPFAGDFDGDTFSFYVVPDELGYEISEVMSPKNLIYYKKNQQHLYMPSHEIMSGLMTSTKVIQNPEGMMEFESFEDANSWRRKHRDFKWNTACIIKNPDSPEESRITTMARYKLSELFGTDLDNYLNGFEDYLNSSNIPDLYSKLATMEDRTDRIQQIQEFALMIATLNGSTAPLLSELHAKLDSSYIDQIREIEKNDVLSSQEKDIKIRAIYDQYLKDTEHGVDSEGNPRISNNLKLKVKESARAKMNQLLNLVTQQLSVGPDKIAHVSETTLVGGMSPQDYARHAIENRATQDIKVSSVPNSGYTTRQLVFLGFPYVYSSETDPKNKGIYLDASRALGRTLVDGTIVTPELISKSKGEKLLVRSIITTSILDRTVITSDCLTNLNTWKDGDQVGTSLLSSLTEGLTQSGLALKHGGALFRMDPKSCIKAPEECTCATTDQYVVLTGKSGKEYIYPKSYNFVVNYTPTNSYKVGEVVGVSYHLSTPSYKLDSVITLIEARRSHSSKRLINNKVLISECYAYGDGKIQYNKVNDKITSITIGSYTYQYNPNSCYFLPQGTEVKKGDRFCTGLMDLDAAINKVNNYVDVFYLFDAQFNELIPNMQSDLIEFLYALLVKRNNGRITRKSVVNAVNETPSIFTRMGFQNARKVFENISPKGAEFLSDTVTSILLPSIFINEI